LFFTHPKNFRWAVSNLKIKKKLLWPWYGLPLLQTDIHEAILYVIFCGCCTRVHFVSPRCWVAMVTIVFGSSVLSLVSHLVLAFAGRNSFWDLVPLFRM
jgi:hypothetical protein